MAKEIRTAHVDADLHIEAYNKNPCNSRPFFKHLYFLNHYFIRYEKAA